MLLWNLTTIQNERLPSYFHYVGQEPLVYRTIGQQLAIAAEKYGDREALVSYAQQKRYTFSEVLKEADRIAAACLNLGLKPGDHVGIWGPNSAEWYLTMMGVTRAGLINVPLNPAYQGPEIAYCLKKVGVKAIFAAETHKTQNYYGILMSIIPEIKTSVNKDIRSSEYDKLSTIVVYSQKNLPGAYRFDDILSLPSEADIRQVEIKEKLIQPDEACNIQFTSGTTGNSKAAVVSHFNFVNNCTHLGKRIEMSLKEHRICLQVPLFHAYGMLGMVGGLVYGTALVLPYSGYNAEASLRSIVDERCTIIFGTPTMYVDMVVLQRELKMKLSTPEIAATGGAPCSPQLFLDIKKVLGLKHVKTIYGLTECTGCAFCSLDNETEYQVTETIGHLLDHLEAKVIDTNGRMVPMGQAGELCIRGYSTMLSYYGDEAKTKEAISNDKWFKTGDQFILEEDGYGKIVGRLKDMIIRGGENIYPKEIEDFLNTHPDIIESHVFGVPDERLSEEVCVHIRTASKRTTLTRSDIKTFCSGKLAHYKIPRYVKVVDDYPKTTSGKIQKFKLRKQFVKDNYED